MYDIKTKLQHLTVSGGCEKIARESLDLIERLERERDCLAKAIGDAAVQIGILKDGTSLTGPQCIQLVDDIVLWAKRSSGESLGYPSVFPELDASYSTE